MNEVKLKKKASKELNEIFQAVEVKFSLLHQEKEDEYEQVHVEGKCRDFLGDCLWSKNFEKPVSLYYFTYDYTKAPYDEDKLKLSLAFPDEKSKENFLKNAETLLHEKELDAGVENLTTIHEVIGKKNMLVVVADKAWLKSPWRISLYTYYLKVASYESEEDLLEPEVGYKRHLVDKVEKILLHNVKTSPELYIEDLRASHNGSGFISTINKGWGNLDHDVIFGGKNV